MIDELALASLDALRKNTLVVVAEGNYGEYGLRSIESSPRWCLTVASCSPKEKFRSTVKFASDAPVTLEDIEGYSISMSSSGLNEDDDYRLVRTDGDIKNRKCIMVIEDDYIVIRPSSMEYNYPTEVPLVQITKETSNILCNYFELVAAQEGNLLAFIKASLRELVIDTPLVSEFSGRGPCSFFTEFMKPDLSAPGEHVAGCWPIDVPLGNPKVPYFFEYNVLSGTSFATPLVASGVATLIVEKNFTVSATISAAMTTADKLHDKDLFPYEFAYGAGVFNLEKAMRPGLVYEETADNFEKYCYPHRNFDKFCFNLNLPYCSATFPSGSQGWDCKFYRKLRSVEKGRCTYFAKVKFRVATIKVPLGSIEFKVVPDTLTFEGENDEQSFALSIYLPNTDSSRYSFGLVSGSLIWVKETEEADEAELVVDSPIILSSRNIPYQ
ncbi:subtilisin-like protease SBT1.9 [Chenopodium quinoa]|uniref:subtilisin-like protease SBT1.9 n=1 Tax=Chenopodium quinoa TaxID=63459 RepID=UPI000B78CF93|nr:subtilisin-like protease SBT1.9 [Chenopodium quinoa]